MLGAFVLQTNCLDHGRRNIREILCSLLALGRHDDVASAIPPVDGTKARSPRRVHQGAYTRAHTPGRVQQGAFTRARSPGRVPRSSKLDSTTDVEACRQDPLKGQALTSSLVHGRRNAETTHGSASTSSLFINEEDTETPCTETRKVGHQRVVRLNDRRCNLRTRSHR